MRKFAFKLGPDTQLKSSIDRRYNFSRADEANRLIMAILTESSDYGQRNRGKSLSKFSILS